MATLHSITFSLLFTSVNLPQFHLHLNHVTMTSSSFLPCNSRLRSAIRRHHPPQRAVLSQICCLGLMITSNLSHVYKVKKVYLVKMFTINTTTVTRHHCRLTYNEMTSPVVDGKTGIELMIPTTQQLGSDLPRRHWSLLNRFRTGQCQCKLAEGYGNCPL